MHRDPKGTFHAKMSTVKDRNGMDLTEAEDIKKRWQECAEELYEKDLHDPDNDSGVITHLELDILECEVKWALGSICMIKASGGDGIPVELPQILKDDAVKVLAFNMSANLENSAVASGLEKVSFIPVPKKNNAKECSNYLTIALISQASKVMHKILQDRLLQYVNHELPNVQLNLEKREEPEIKLPTSVGSLKKQESPRKTSTFALLTIPKPLSVCITTNCGRDGNTRQPFLPPEKSVCRSGSNS